MWALNIADRLSKIVTPPARWSSIAGVVAMSIIMLVVAIDVFMRFALSQTLPGTIYIIGLMLIIVFFAPNADCELRGEHIQVDVLVKQLPPKVAKLIETNGYFISIGIVITLATQFFVQAQFYYKGNIVTGQLSIPEWIFIMLGGIFMIPFALALIVSFLRNLGQSFSLVGQKAYPFILPGFILAVALFTFSLWPDLLPSGISRSTWGIVVFGFLFVMIFLKVHIAAAMTMAAFLGFSYLVPPAASLANLSMTFIAVANQYTWSVAPLFLWMGTLAFYAGFAKEIYEVARIWLARLPGGLASASTGACGVLAAITGSSMTGVLTMGVLGLPEMRRYKYDMKLATASICAASTVGMLIPPSLGFIVYAFITQESVGKLFMAGIIPGILFIGMLIIMITVMTTVNKRLGPPGPSTAWREKIVSLKSIWAVSALIIFVLGGIYGGLFTATEAGAMGSFGAMLIGFLRKKLSWKGFMDSAMEAVRINAIIIFIFIAATALSAFIAGTNLSGNLADWVIGLNLSKYIIMAFILFIYMILGCVMNALPAVILTLPFFFPIAVAAGWDPILLGVLIVVMVDLGQITPPIGMNVFAMSAIAKDVPMYSIFRGIIPFWIAFLVLIVLLVIFPQISLWLPNMMFK